MLKSLKKISVLIAIAVLAIAMLFQGCVTPIEIKRASLAQIELIDSIDGAVVDLQSALDQFHGEKANRILAEGYMLIARNAIDVAVSNSNSMVTADQLFDTYKQKIEPWVDNAFRIPFIDDRIAALEKKIVAATDPVLRVSMQNDLDDLKLLKATLENKPKPVKDIESIIMEDLKKERMTAEKNRKILEILRAQVALMKAVHGTVDTWLAIDVTVTQEQADALKEAFSSAFKEIEGGTQ
jgi:hypothetical protein